MTKACTDLYVVLWIISFVGIYLGYRWLVLSSEIDTMKTRFAIKEAEVAALQKKLIEMIEAQKTEGQASTH